MDKSHAIALRDHANELEARLAHFRQALQSATHANAGDAICNQLRKEHNKIADESSKANDAALDAEIDARVTHS